MTAKFNFLSPRTAVARAAQELRRRFPGRSAAWIENTAKRNAGTIDITAELRAPERASVCCNGNCNQGRTCPLREKK